MLSCPSSGLEFDARTLKLVDEGKDGRIRMPEVLAAVDWLCARLCAPSVIAGPEDALPLDCIDTEKEEEGKLSREDWGHVQKAFAAYTSVQGRQPQPVQVEVVLLPTAAPVSLGMDRVSAILDSGIGDKFFALADHDTEVPAAAQNIKSHQSARGYVGSLPPFCTYAFVTDRQTGRG